MRVLGALVIITYAYLTFWGVEPFTTTERGQVPQQVRRTPGGLLLWHGGYLGGK